MVVYTSGFHVVIVPVVTTSLDSVCTEVAYAGVQMLDDVQVQVDEDVVGVVGFTLVLDVVTP